MFDHQVSEIRWNSSLSPSALHAAATIIETESAPGAIGTDELHESAMLLKWAIGRYPTDQAALLRNLVFLAGRYPSNRSLAIAAVRKVLPAYAPSNRTSSYSYSSNSSHQRLCDDVVNAITAIEAAFPNAFPDWQSKVESMTSTLQRSWRTRGLELMRRIQLTIDPRTLPETAEVVVVHPIVGAASLVDPFSNLIVLEADEDAINERFGSVETIAWLMMTLNLDRETDLPRTLIQSTGKLSMLPVVVSAASQDECTTADLIAAMRAWNVHSSGAETLAPVLMNWWRTVRTRRPRWGVAVAGLARLVQDAVPPFSGVETATL